MLVRGLESGRDTMIEAPFFIDATPYGDLLELAGVEHVLGAESRADTGEPHASERADPETSRRSRSVSRWNISPAKTTRSTSLASTRAGALSSRRVGQAAC